jgi:hypothetical protein
MKPFSRADEKILKQKAKYPRFQQNGDGQHAIHLRPDLETVRQQIPRRNGAAGGRAMIEFASAVLGLVSVAIFAAHALDAYRTG